MAMAYEQCVTNVAGECTRWAHEHDERGPCSHCPPGCRSCWPPDCECYTHQDEPDKRFALAEGDPS